MEVEAATGSQPEFIKTVEDKVDAELWKVDWANVGKNHQKGTLIKLDELRSEPWDPQVLHDKGIKFLSFHRFV